MPTRKVKLLFRSVKSSKALFLSLFFVCVLAGCDKLFPKPVANEKTAADNSPSSVTPKPDAAKVELSPAATASAPTLPQNVLVKVGNWTMTTAEFKERLAAVKEFIPDFNPKDKEAKKFVLDEIIKQQLLVEDAEKKGLGRNKDVLQAVEEFRRTLLVRELANQLTKDAQVTEPEAEEYYNQNKKEFVAPGEWHIREIMVDSEDEAKKLLVDVLQGGDFAQAAKDHSKAPSAAQGGDLGFVSQFEFPEMGDVVKVLNVGGVSSVVKGPKGYYILKLEEKKGGEQKEFAEIKEEIKSGLLMLKQQQAVIEYLDKLRQNATVDVNEKLLEEQGL